MGEKQMYFLDLFAGIGGFRLGLEQAGHKCVGYVEIDKYARKSYQAIYDTRGEWTREDITKITNKEWSELNGTVELITGGFPCQAFSIAGQRRGFNDTRGTLFFEIARAAKQIKPRFLLLENVKGLLSHDKGQTFATILSALDEIGYDAEWQVLNSKHFGVPQNRERVYIVASTREQRRRKIFPIGIYGKQTVTQLVQGNRCDRYHDKGVSVGLVPKTGNKKGKVIDFTKALKIREGTKKGYTYAEPSDIIDYSYANSKTRRGRVSKDYAKTLLTSTEQGVVSEDLRIRRLTPLECWRLQSFPDWAYERAKEVNSDTQLYKQAGNSVTVTVITEIAKKIS